MDSMQKSERERTLEQLGIKVRDDADNIRTAEELAAEFMELFMRCDGDNRARLLMMIAIANHMDNRR